MERDQKLGEEETLENPPAEETGDVPVWPPLLRQGFSREDVPSPFEGMREGEEEANRESDLAPQFLKLTATAVGEPESSPKDSALPRQPRALVDVGLSKLFLTDLTLKMVHYSGTPSVAQLVRRLGLGQALVQELLSALAEDRLVEVLSQSDLFTGNYQYRLSERGNQRVREALERTRYAGPAPVTAEQYNEVIRRQLSNWQAPSRSRLKEVLNELVLSGEVADAVARALHSGRAALLYGPSGNGKTSMLERFTKSLDGVALVPYAIYAHGQVIRVFDQSIHEPVGDLDSRNALKDDSKMDRRWVLVRRPAVVMGAEIGHESLDLAYDPQARFYQAPPHIKAQGGVLLVDDFGRQKAEAKDLLTRWLIPLERGWDTLGLVTGEKVTVPFKIQLLLATNLDIRMLADDALLRRILYKVKIPDPRPQDFGEIMRRMCRQRRVLVSDGALNYIVERLYSQLGIEPRASQARDLVDMIVEGAAFDGCDPVLSRESFDRVLRMSVLLPEGKEPAS